MAVLPLKDTRQMASLGISDCFQFGKIFVNVDQEDQTVKQRGSSHAPPQKDDSAPSPVTDSHDNQDLSPDVLPFYPVPVTTTPTAQNDSNGPLIGEHRTSNVVCLATDRVYCHQRLQQCHQRLQQALSTTKTSPATLVNPGFATAKKVAEKSIFISV